MSGLADLEARLLASIPTIDTFLELEKRGITEASFVTYGPMYSYIRQTVEEHAHLPRLRDLQETFNVPAHVKREPEEYDWLLAEFTRLTTAQRVQSILDESVTAHSDNPQDMVQTMIQDLSGLVIQDRREMSITDAGASERMDTYKDRALDPNKMAGMPTGLSYFDAVCRVGWMPGELIGLAARIYLGKTWFLIHFGLLAWQQRKRVLLLSPELPQEEAEARWDALLCGMNNIGVDSMDFYRGFKPTDAQVQMATKFGSRQDWVTVTSVQGRPFSLTEIPRLVQRHAPDLVLIDGLGFLQLPGRQRQSWERIWELSYGLKNIAVGQNVAVIVTHQANRAAANTGRPPGLHELFAGDGFGQACDRLLVLSQPKNEEEQRVITIQKFRRGRPEQRGTYFCFDPSRGRIHEIANPSTTGGSGTTGTNVQRGKGNARSVPIP